MMDGISSTSQTVFRTLRLVRPSSFHWQVVLPFHCKTGGKPPRSRCTVWKVTQQWLFECWVGQRAMMHIDDVIGEREQANLVVKMASQLHQ